ncbi:MAG: radical SAM protein, partial [Polyangiaceae bacterium]|nr:radical SAM protein [Polyangiaceae bacterium]
LESCIYGCEYCPFAKKKEGRAELSADRRALERFIAWAAGESSRSLGIFFTPWGEALVRRWYRDAIVSLSRLSNVSRVAIQTNLSAPLAFLGDADAGKVGLWCTYHPEWTTRDRFVARIRELADRGISHSVGVVGMRRFIDEIAKLRQELPASTYLWVNAVKSHRGGERYTEAEVRTLASIDPFFETNRIAHSSRGKSCRTGESVVSVDGDGVVRRCHFVREPIAQLYEPGSLDRALAPRACPNDTCGCHIGYVHLDELELYRSFAGGVLERSPAAGLVELRRRANALSSH